MPGGVHLPPSWAKCAHGRARRAVLPTVTQVRTTLAAQTDVSRAFKALALVVACLMSGAGCRDDQATTAASPPPPPPKPANSTTTEASDAGSESSSSSTSSARDSKSASARDASPPDGGRRDAAPDGGTTSSEGTDSSGVDAGDGGADGGSHCAPSYEPTDASACTEAMEDWCDSEFVVGLCASLAFTLHEQVFGALVECLNDTFRDGEACEGELEEVVSGCADQASSGVCVSEVPECGEYSGCESTSIAQCNEQAAKYNRNYIGLVAGYFSCGYEPSAAFGG